MTAAEKRFLKIHFSSVKSHLTDLFDFINAMDKYDEQVVKSHFADSLISKNLKVYKVQLTDLILRSQVAYHAKRKVRSSIRILLEEIDILVDQNLFQQASFRLNKAITICKKNNENTLLLVTLHHQLKLHRLLVRHDINLDQPIDFLATLKVIKTIELELKIIQLAGLTDHHFMILSEPQRIQAVDVLKEIPSHDEMLNGNGLNAYLLAKSIALVSTDMKERATKQEAIVNRFRKKEYKFVYANVYFWEALCELFYTYVSQGRKPAVNRIIEELSQLYATGSIKKGLLFMPCYIEARYNYHHGTDEARLPKLGGFQGKPFNTKMVTNNVFCLKFYICQMLHHLTKAEEGKAKELLSELQAVTKSAYPDIYVLLDMIEMIDHYESDNGRTVSYLLSGIQRKIKRGRTFTPFTLAFFDFLKKLMRYPAEKKQLIETFRKEMNSFQQDNLFELWKYFHLNDWLDCLDHAIPFYEVDKKKTTLSRSGFHITLAKDLLVK